MIGVHSAKFRNERESGNIRKAILRHGLRHPVVNDSNFVLWRSYGVRSWPTLVLIDPEGNIAGVAPGEGNHDALDRAIAELIDRHADRLKRGALSWKLEVEKESLLSFPGKLCVHGDRLYIADTNHHRIVVCDLEGQVLEVIGSGERGHRDGSYAEARFNQPQGVIGDGDSLFVADVENHRVRRVDLAAREVGTVAGMGKQVYSRRGGKALETPLNSPWDLARDGSRLYIAMAGNHSIWVLDREQDWVGPFAGNGREALIDGPLSHASFNQPSGLVVIDDALFVADSEISGVRRVDLRLGDAGSVRTIVGTGLFDFGDKDGIGPEALLQHVLAVHAFEGKLLVADSYNHKIKIVDPKTREARTFLGDGKPGLVDGPRPRFYEPSGLWVHGGRLYVADQNNHAIRVCDLATREVTTLPLRMRD